MICNIICNKIRGIKLKRFWKRTDQNEIKERGLVDLDEIGVPGLEIFLRGFVVGIGGVDVFFAVLDDFGEDLAGDVGERDAAVGAVVLNHVLYRLRLQRHRLVHLERLAVRTLQGDLPRWWHDFISTMMMMLILKERIERKGKVTNPNFSLIGMKRQIISWGFIYTEIGPTLSLSLWLVRFDLSIRSWSRPRVCPTVLHRK